METPVNWQLCFPAGSFDLILCHNVLEFVDDPPSVLRSVARTLRPSGIISILVRNQTGEVLKSALVNADLIAAERNLTSEWGDKALWGKSAGCRGKPAFRAGFGIINHDCRTWGAGHL